MSIRKKNQRNPPSPSPITSRAPRSAPGADLYSIDVVISVGMPQTGKSSGMKALVAAEPRLLVWDPNSEWRNQRCQSIDSMADLKAALLARGAAPARFAYVPPDFGDFLAFCELARAWAEPDRADRAPCCVMVEELGDVVPPGRAPRQWGQLTRSGRHRGIKVRAVGHSPKEIDKTVLRSASTWRVHTLGSAGDCEYMAEQFLYVDPEQLIALQPFQYIEVVNAYPRVPVLKNTAKT